MIDHSEVVEKMNAKYGPLYAKSIIPAGTYPGQAKDNQISAVWNILVGHETMTNEVAYNIVKTIFEKREEWGTVHKEALSLNASNQKAANSPVKFHPGALKYFEEKGIKVN